MGKVGEGEGEDSQQDHSMFVMLGNELPDFQRAVMRRDKHRRESEVIRERDVHTIAIDQAQRNERREQNSGYERRGNDVTTRNRSYVHTLGRTSASSVTAPAMRAAV